MQINSNHIKDQLETKRGHRLRGIRMSELVGSGLIRGRSGPGKHVSSGSFDADARLVVSSVARLRLQSALALRLALRLLAALRLRNSNRFGLTALDRLGKLHCDLEDVLLGFRGRRRHLHCLCALLRDAWH